METQYPTEYNWDHWIEWFLENHVVPSGHKPSQTSRKSKKY